MEQLHLLFSLQDPTVNSGSYSVCEVSASVLVYIWCNTPVYSNCVCSLNKLLQWGAVTNKLSLRAISWYNRVFSFFFALQHTPSLFQVLQRQMLGARRNWILHSPCSHWAVPRAKMAELKFQISPRAVQTPATLLQTGWQAQSPFESPRAGCNRHWAGLNLNPTLSVLWFKRLDSFRSQQKAATSLFNSWLGTHLQLCQLFRRGA